MISRKNSPLGMFLAIGLTSLGFAACSSDTDAPGGTGGTATGGASAGSTGHSGGTVPTAGTATGGSLPSGGVATGGSPGTGGNATGGIGTTAGTSSGAGSGGLSSTGGASGGSQATGGVSGSGSGGRGGSGGSGGGSSGGSGSCEKGQTKPAEVVFMGESFYAIAPQYIQNRVQDNARKAGSLAAGATYRNVAVSGQNMNYIATAEWTAATQGGASVKLVIMDGGGIDCLGGSSCPTCANDFTTLLGKMATAGVKDVVYTRYPEPGAPPGSNASLKACLDQTMPNMETVCKGSTSPKCHWVDLRPVWVAGDTTDGLHPTQSGGEHVGDLLWSELTKACLAQ